MKKLLACLTAGLLVAGASSSVVACSQKTIASLNDKAYLLKTTDDKEKYDVMRWSNDVLTADAYKKEFISSFKENVIEVETPDDPWTRLEIIKGHQREKPAEGSSTLISQLIVEYQKSSNTGEKTGKFLDPKFYDSELTYRIYDENNKNNNDNLVTSFNDKIVGEWSDVENRNLVLKKEGDVYVVHFKIAIETIHSEYFIGAKQKIDKDTNLADYYQGLDKDKLPKTSDFDYRFDIQFYFSFN